MSTLRVDHPSILEFLDCKKDLKELQNFNISVSITSAFMQAVKDNTEYALVNPRNGQEVQLLKAREVFNKLAENAWLNGEPGILFIDEINKYNPTPQVGDIESTNPCVSGDTWIHTTEGSFQVRDVLGKPLSLLLNGEVTPTSERGFFKTGTKDLLRITTVLGTYLRVTPDHLVYRKGLQGVEAVAANRLTPEDLLISARKGRSSEEEYVQISSITPDGTEDVYDVQVPGINRFAANNLLVHNCGELPALPYESCNLGSINVSNYVKDGSIDWESLREDIHLTVRFLDNVLEINKFPLPQIEELTKANRKIGLGIMGWADLLIKLKIPYASSRAVFLGEELMAGFQNAAWQASTELAVERGPFPNWEKSVLPSRFLKPVRNATTTTVAPTGTISIIADCSSGIEPLFGLAFEKHVMDGTVLVETHKLFLETAKQQGFYSDQFLADLVKRGSLRTFPNIPQHLKEVFCIAQEISPEWHVRMQAAFQKFTDNAVSKTINFPNSATIDQVKDAYLLAHSMNCKGLTVYRDGSRDGQVLNLGTPKPKETVPPATVSRLRPMTTFGATERTKIGCGNLYVTVNADDHGVCEVFTSLGRAGGCPSQSEATARLVSMALRAGLSVEDITEQLKGIRCLSTLKRGPGENGSRVLSCPDAIGKAIERFHKQQKLLREPLEKLPEVRPATSQKLSCPECANPLENSGGCVICPACGYSKCG